MAISSQVLSDDKIKELLKSGQVDEYFSSVEEKEKLQSPFKNWSDKLLCRYKEALKMNHHPIDAEMHYLIAEAFFERIFSLGYLEFSQITKKFVQTDFIDWMLESSLLKHKRQEIHHSLKILFHFIQASNLINLRHYGFEEK